MEYTEIHYVLKGVWRNICARLHEIYYFEGQELETHCPYCGAEIVTSPIRVTSLYL